MKQKFTTIKASIVICSYNGAKNIKKCINSLVNQSYPKDNYEIILIDDGSTDNTYKIASTLPIKIIRHTNNQGLSAARNTGLQHAKGEIYICFDDDCFADRNWLEELMKIYTNQTAGVCGITKNSTSGIIDKFLSEIGHGNPSPAKDETKNSIAQRLFIYVKDMYNRTSPKTHSHTFRVNEIWGENCSFPSNILKQINGWDKNLSGVEDTDLCERIKRVTKHPFMCTTKAIIFHDGKTPFYQLIKKPYQRGDAVLRFYLQNNKFPPIFPFPLIILTVTIVSMSIIGSNALLMLILFPQVLYGWWLVKLIKTKKLYYLLFPYIQLSLEVATLLGLLKGYSTLVINSIREMKKINNL